MMRLLVTSNVANLLKGFHQTICMLQCAPRPECKYHNLCSVIRALDAVVRFLACCHEHVVSVDVTMHTVCSRTYRSELASVRCNTRSWLDMSGAGVTHLEGSQLRNDCMLHPQHTSQLPASQAKATEGHSNPQRIHLQHP